MHTSTPESIERSATKVVARAACLVLLWSMAAGAHAASVYKCVDAHGHLAFRDTPCAGDSHQSKLDVQPLPAIGDPSEVAALRARSREISNTRASSGRQGRTSTPRAAKRANAKQETSWECRAADGEVFYRHTRCPGSVPGDGTVRGNQVAQPKNSRSRSRQGAWARVPVHGTKISRAEACRRIESAGAAGRDGHARDETVSTYDHLMGRDPCT